MLIKKEILKLMTHQLNLENGGLFWDVFFNKFINEVHPAEFALQNSKQEGSVREWALSSAIQRTLYKYCLDLEIIGWFPGIEAPYLNDKNNKDAWVDITLFPWDEHNSNNRWNRIKDIKEHIRIELKWYDKKLNNHELINQDMLEKFIKENDTDQHFVLILVFHDQGCPSVPGLKLQKPWGIIFNKPLVRPKETFNKEYEYFSLIVLNNEDQE